MRRLLPCLIALFVAGFVIHFRSAQDPSPEPVRQIAVPVGKTPNVDVLPVESDDALGSLRAAFETDQSTAKRLRLQSKLVGQWKASLPVDQLVDEIIDREAPQGYRAYLARLLRNAAKKDGSVYAGSGERLCGALTDANDSLDARGEIARALIDVDESDEMVAAIAGLLSHSRNDAEANLIVSSLTRTKHAFATEALWAFVQSHHEDHRTYPKALATALLPLSHRPDIPMGAFLTELSSEASDPTLLASVSKALANQKTHE